MFARATGAMTPGGDEWACQGRTGSRLPYRKGWCGRHGCALKPKAVQANTTHEQRWIVLYVRRWLAAPIVMPDGRLEERDRGTPQGWLCSALHKDPPGSPSERRWTTN